MAVPAAAGGGRGKRDAAMNWRNVVLRALLAGACMAPSVAWGQTADADKGAIRAAFQEWVRVAECGDADTYLSFITDDAVVMAPGQPEVVGKQAIVPGSGTSSRGTRSSSVTGTPRRWWWQGTSPFTDTPAWRLSRPGPVARHSARTASTSTCFDAVPMVDGGPRTTCSTSTGENNCEPLSQMGYA